MFSAISEEYLNAMEGLLWRIMINNVFLFVIFLIMLSLMYIGYEYDYQNHYNLGNVKSPMLKISTSENVKFKRRNAKKVNTNKYMNKIISDEIPHMKTNLLNDTSSKSIIKILYWTQPCVKATVQNSSVWGWDNERFKHCTVRIFIS